ncbi:penicillin-binding protein 2 [bacterium]|nr:MAG: penicillin-binding protein 2 [bacterium]
MRPLVRDRRSTTGWSRFRRRNPLSDGLSPTECDPVRRPTRRTSSLPGAIDTGRFRLAACATAGLFLLAVGSQAKLQIGERKKTIDLADKANRFTRRRTDEPSRGSILDRNGHPLAQDETATELTVRFDKTPNSEAFFVALASASGIPAEEIAEQADSGATSRVWTVALSSRQRNQLADVRRKFAADGVSIAPSGARAYPMGEDAACLLGTIREFADTGVVRTGLEKKLDADLTGEAGYIAGLTDKKGRFLPGRITDRKERRDGDDITLTVDSDLQKVAFTAIKDAVTKYKATNGAAIVLDPVTGDILAMANYPSYYPTPVAAEGAGKNTAGLNPAYMSILEPGSTFKILTLAKALDEGKATLHGSLHCSGVLQLNKYWRVRCDSHHGNRAHGSIDATTAIAKSCNVSAATWALRVGREDFLSYIKDLGLLRKTKTNLEGELRGRYNENEYAKPLQLANFGFGQSISCTPLALAGAFGMLGNGGTRMEPRIVSSIGGKPVPIEEGKRILSEEAASETMEAMEAVIMTKAGTGKKLAIPGYRLAGKTGTAQKIGGGTGKGYVSNFVGYVPAGKPKAMVLVMVNDPKSGTFYGGDVAGPAFRTIAKSVIDRYHIAPTEPILPEKKN